MIKAKFQKKCEAANIKIYDIKIWKDEIDGFCFLIQKKIVV